MTYGRDLRALRKRQGLTLREFGRLCGISGDELARYERGEKSPRQENTRKIADALGEPILAIRNGLVWTEDEKETRPEALREGILELMRETFGGLEAGTFQDSLGRMESCYIAGVPPDTFTVYEEDLETLAESIKASAISLAEHMKDVRPEEDIQRELLEGLGTLPPEEDAPGLTDQQWQAIQDLLPPENTGRGRAYKDNRLVLEGILYWMRTGTAWKKLPERYGRFRCVRDRLRLWNETGLWPKVLARMLALNIISEHEIVVDRTTFRK